MNIREIEIQLPDSYVAEQITKRYFQGPYSSASATFDPQSLMVNCRPPVLPSRRRSGNFVVYADEYFEHLRKRLSEATTPEEQFAILLKDTAWQHEIQHFHDCICTPSGICAFIAELELVNLIYGGLNELKFDGWAGKYPILRESQTNATVGAVFSAYCNLISRRILRDGDLPTLEAPYELADYDIVWGSAKELTTPVRIPFFASRVTVDGSRTCHLLPIGFRAITECRSVQTQTIIMRTFGQQYVDMYLKVLRPYPQYRVVNLLVTRLALNNGLNPFEGDWGDALFRVCGAALARAGSPDLWRTPGVELVELLKELPPEQILQKSFRDQNLKFARDTIASLNYPVQTNPWCGFWVRDFAIKSFCRSVEVCEAAKDDEWGAPDSLLWYMALATTLPQPIAFLEGDEIRFHPEAGQEMIERYRINVSVYLLFRCLIEQVMFDDKIVCPALEGQYEPLLQSAKLHPFCPKGASEGGCGRFRIGADLSQHPDCAFRALAVNIGLVKGPIDSA